MVTSVGLRNMINYEVEIFIFQSQFMFFFHKKYIADKKK